MTDSTSPLPVAICGAGPGDPELLTVKALRLIQAAQVVVYDKLVSDEVLELIPAGATRIFAGKQARNHHMPQPEINALLVTLARSGRRVVRLKGGDPFVFGRGGEEALHLADNHIPFEVVPGITSSAGATAYAGIPLTHRGLSHGVRFVTGHTQDSGDLALNWASLADPKTTLVIYMGLTNIEEITEKLIDHGMPADIPAAAINQGTRSDQRALVTTLENLPGEVRQLDISGPTLIVVGHVCALSDNLRWFETLAPSAEARGTEPG